MRLALAIVVCFMLSGCYADPSYKSQSSNPKVEVQLLFEYDGCSVYRFWDGGYARYFVNCRSGSSVEYNEYQGKTSRTDSISTSYEATS